MKFSFSIPILLFSFLFLSFSSAQHLEARRDYGHTDVKVKCTTTLDLKKHKHVPTQTKTKVIHKPARTVTSTKYPKVTVTPKTITVISTKNEVVTASTTLLALTDTFSTTSTLFETSTTVLVELVPTTIEATETTTLTMTNTIGAPPSFTPASLTKNKRVAAPGRRDLQFQRQEDSTLFSRSSKGRFEINCNAPPRLWPESVTCVKKKVVYPPQHTVTKNSKKTHTVTARPAETTSTKTLVSTSTSTFVPAGVSVTESFSVTETKVETSTVFSATTVFSTTTVSAFAPEETQYAACGADNLLNTGLSGNPINALVINSQNARFKVVSSTTALNCCAACQGSPSCLGSFFYDFNGIQACYTVEGATCPAGGSGLTDQPSYYLSGPGAIHAVVSNGQCSNLYDGTQS